MNLLQNYNQFNEGVRDQMTPKSDEEIRAALDKLPVDQRLRKAMGLKIYSEKELNELMDELNPTARLNFGVYQGSLYAVKSAFKDGADIHFDDDYPLRYSVEFSHPEIVNFLIEKGANVSACDDWTLKYICEKGNVQIAKMLIDEGADVTSADNACLKLAAKNGHTDIVELLLENGADVHAKNDIALQWAVHYNRIETVKVLLEHGANVHSERDLAIKWAKKKEFTQISDLLEKYM